MGRCSPNPATHGDTLFVFLARNAARLGAQTGDPSEVVQYEFVPLADLARLLDAGAIVHAMHVGSLFTALRRAGLLGRLA